MMKSKMVLCIILVLYACNVVCDEHPKVKEMKQAVDVYLDENINVPGAVVLVKDHKGRINWVYTAGYSDLEKKLPMDPKHTFRIGSNTKTMVATVLLQLIDEGVLTLDDKVSDYFPDLKNADNITIQMLAYMTSEISDYSESKAFTAEVIKDPTRVWYPEELVNIGLSNNSDFEPGASYKYSNTNTILLGMIIEQVTDNTLEEEINARIIDPLNLQNTGLLTSGLDLPNNHGRGYYSYEFKPQEEVIDFTEVVDQSIFWAAGSGYSTVYELSDFVKSAISGNLMSNKMHEQWLNSINDVGQGDKIGYGLYLVKRGSFFGHNGGIPGFTSSMYHSIDKDCTIIIYFNCHLEGDGIKPDDLFMELVKTLYGDNY